MTATAIAGNPASYFHRPSITAWLSYFDLAPDTTDSERDVLDEIFRAAIAEGSLDSGVFGLRLQRPSFDFLVQKLAVLHPGLSTDAQRFEAAFGSTLFVHLTRHDKVEQAISYVKAHQTGLWHVGPDGTELERLSPPKDPVYDAGEIRSRRDELTAYERGWEGWFARENIVPLRITYEALAAAPIKSLRRILDHLGLDREAARSVKPGVAKLADESSHQWSIRFRAEQDAV